MHTMASSTRTNRWTQRHGAGGPQGTRPRAHHRCSSGRPHPGHGDPTHIDHHHLEEQEHGHSHGAHGHSHGLVDRSIVRSRDGVRTVSISLAVLGTATIIQALIYAASGSVALLADLVHNFGDALTAVPVGAAFFLRSFRGERIAGLLVVLAIFVSACFALYASIQRLLHPHTLSHLGVLAAAGVVGLAGNELAAQARLRGGRRLNSPALIADGNHARVDGFVSLSVVVSAVLVGLGLQRADPVIGVHHGRDSQDHLGLVAHGLRGRTGPSDAQSLLTRRIPR